MMALNWLEVITGFSIFLFSIRLLNSVLERSLAKRLRPILNRFLVTNFQCLTFGFFSTVILQASSITIIATTSLLNVSLLNLEQGIVIMLGATVGTTLKIWVFMDNIRNYGLILISVGSIALLASKKPLARDFWEVLLVIGLAFFGFNLMILELLPLSQNPDFVSIMGLLDASEMRSQVFGMFIGMILTIFLQSSSTFILLVVGFASQDIVSYSAGVALILGANLGTTSTILLATLEYGPSAKRLAVAHLIVKSTGVTLTILCFPYFLNLVDILIPGTTQEHIEYHLACAHTTFNILNILFWTPLSFILVKCMKWLIPEENDKDITLSNTIRRILVSNPDLTFQEIDSQVLKAENCTKQLTDYMFDMLLNYTVSTKKNTLKSVKLARNFENIKECILELLIKTSLRHNLSDEATSYTRLQMQFINRYTNFYYRTLSLCNHLERGITLEYHKFPEELRIQLKEIQKHFNEIWFCISQKQPGITPCEYTMKELILLEQAYFNCLANKASLSHENFAWIYDIINYLYEIFFNLKRLAQNPASTPFWTITEKFGG